MSRGLGDVYKRQLLLIAKNDEMGKVIQDIDLKNKKRVTGK